MNRERYALLGRLMRLAGPNGQAGGVMQSGETWIITSHTETYPADAGAWCAPGWVPGEESPNAPTQQGFGHFDRIARQMKEQA